MRVLYILAEQAGFEPAVGDYPTHAFQACDLNTHPPLQEARIVAEGRGRSNKLSYCCQSYPN